MILHNFVLIIVGVENFHKVTVLYSSTIFYDCKILHLESLATVEQTSTSVSHTG